MEEGEQNKSREQDRFASLPWLGIKEGEGEGGKECKMGIIAREKEII